MGWVQRSFASSPQVYSVTVIASSVGSVTHNAKFTLPSPSVSYRLQASSVLLPLTLISSQFQVTVRIPDTELSTQSCVRSFCPGSSLAPAVSSTQFSAAFTPEDTNTATPSARKNAIAKSVKREVDLFPLIRSLNDGSMAEFPFIGASLHELRAS